MSTMGPAPKVRRLSLLERILVGALAIVFVAGLLTALFVVSKLGDIKDLQTHGDCRARVEAEFFTGVADALNAPPAPNPARAAATAEIKRAAARLHNLDKVCS